MDMLAEAQFPSYSSSYKKTDYKLETMKIIQGTKEENIHDILKQSLVKPYGKVTVQENLHSIRLHTMELSDIEILSAFPAWSKFYVRLICLWKVNFFITVEFKKIS